MTSSSDHLQSPPQVPGAVRPEPAPFWMRLGGMVAFLFATLLFKAEFEPFAALGVPARTTEILITIAALVIMYLMFDHGNSELKRTYTKKARSKLTRINRYAVVWLILFIFGWAFALTQLEPLLLGLGVSQTAIGYANIMVVLGGVGGLIYYLLRQLSKEELLWYDPDSSGAAPLEQPNQSCSMPRAIRVCFVLIFALSAIQALVMDFDYIFSLPKGVTWAGLISSFFAVFGLLIVHSVKQDQRPDQFGRCLRGISTASQQTWNYMRNIIARCFWIVFSAMVGLLVLSIFKEIALTAPFGSDGWTSYSSFGLLSVVAVGLVLLGEYRLRVMSKTSPG